MSAIYIVMGLCAPCSLAYLFLPWARTPALGVTVEDHLGGPGNLSTELGVKHLIFRCPEILTLDGKLPERFDPAKLYVAGTADLKWVSEGCRLLVDNGLEPLFLSPGTVDQVAHLVARSREVGLLAHIGATKLGYTRQYSLKLEPFSYVLSAGWLFGAIHWSQRMSPYSSIVLSRPRQPPPSWFSTFGASASGTLPFLRSFWAVRCCLFL